MDTLIAWIMRAIPFGTIIMYGAMGEIVTEKSGNLNPYRIFFPFIQTKIRIKLMKTWIK